MRRREFITAYLDAETLGSTFAVATLDASHL